MAHEFKQKDDEYKDITVCHPGTKIPISEPYSESIPTKTPYYEYQKNNHPGTTVPLGEEYEEPLHRRK